MTALAIPPHSKRLSGLAIVTLVMLAAGSFGVGFARQFDAAGPSPFPAAQRVAGADAIPEATPAPALQVAATEPPAHRPAAAPPPDVSAALPDAPVPGAAPAPEASPAADASATVPDQPAPAPDAAEPPT